VGLITRRSSVQIRLPQPNIKKGYSKEWPFLCAPVLASLLLPGKKLFPFEHLAFAAGDVQLFVQSSY
ncbi:hypothetical protein ACW9H6_29350, partial [Pseudomonas sp. SDO528_S397]